ncbi:MAG TPA: permease [Candidatus Methylacidiphilales bacterium]
MGGWFSFPDFFLSFAALLLEGLPFLLLGALGSLAVELLLPASWLRALLRLGPRGGVAAGCLAGFVFPLCECGALPVVLRLVRKGVPLRTAAAYLFAAPLANPFSIASTWLAFRSQEPWKVVALRLGWGLCVVLALVFWVGRKPAGEVLKPGFGAETESPSPASASEGEPVSPGLRRLRAALGPAVDDFLSVALYLVVGAAVASFLNTAVDRGALARVSGSPVLAPVAMTALAQLLSVCSTTDAFLAAALPQFPLPALLAFLVAGPLFDLKLLWVYQALFARRVVLGLWLIVTAGALVPAWVCLWVWHR